MGAGSAWHRCINRFGAYSLTAARAALLAIAFRRALPLGLSSKTLPFQGFEGLPVRTGGLRRLWGYASAR